MTVTTPTRMAASAGSRAALRTRRRTAGARFGALPVSNVVVLELGIAVAMLLLAVDRGLLPASLAVALLTLLAALIRWRGRWFTQWVALIVRYLLRSHTRVARPVAADVAGPHGNAAAITGPQDARVATLRLAVPDLSVARSIDHDRRTVGLAWHRGCWTATLLVEPPEGPVQQVVGTPNLPLGALAPTLEDRGVVLDAIGVISHCYPGNVSLPADSPVLESYLEVLGPLPATARRTTWVVVRLDPRRCPAAVQERGGGVVGAHRALIGALSRVRGALQAHGVRSRPLDVDELLGAGLAAAELRAAAEPGLAAADRRVLLRERWAGVTAGGVQHASYAITRWPPRGRPQSLDALTGVRAVSTTVALSIAPSGETGHVGLRGLVRVSARTAAELSAADERLRLISARSGVRLTPLRGLQLAGLAATLPLGGSA